MADHKNKKQNETVDAGLCGNEKIEEAIAALQQEPTQEMLAHTLTVIRRRMQENGQFIVAVEPPTGDGNKRCGGYSGGCRGICNRRCVEYGKWRAACRKRIS